MNLVETAQFLRLHAVAFPCDPAEASLLAIAIHALTTFVEMRPELKPNVNALLKEIMAL